MTESSVEAFNRILAPDHFLYVVSHEFQLFSPFQFHSVQPVYVLLILISIKPSIPTGISNLLAMTTKTAHWFIERGFVEVKVSDLPKNKQSMYNYRRNARIFSKTL